MRELQRSYEFFLQKQKKFEVCKRIWWYFTETTVTPLDIEHFLSKQLYVVVYPRYHTRITLSSRSDSQETVQRKVKVK